MKREAFYLVLPLIVWYFIGRTGGAVVNINLVGFADGILMVPENQMEGRIEVLLSEAVNLGNATVVCISLDTGPDLTAVQFTSSLASLNTTQVHVTFRIISAGKPVTIQCSAQSQGNNTQFTSSGSRGNTGLLQVTKAPTVHICPDAVLVQKYQLNSTFEVQFSEKIEWLPVQVKCSTVEPDPGGPPVLQIKFGEVIAGLNQRTAQVSYEIVSLGGPLQVICRAQSTNLTERTAPTQPTVATSVTSLVSSVHQTTTPIVNEISTVGLKSMSVSGIVPASSGGSSRKRRRRSTVSSDEDVLQYRFNTSEGPAATFALDLSPLRILAPAGFIRAPNGSFSAVLALDHPADNTVDIVCSLEVVLPGNELHNAAGYCFGSVTDKVTLANNSVEIKLGAKEIQFQKDEVFKKISLTLSGSPAQRADCLVRLTCCGQATGLSLRYVNETAVAFVWVEVRKLHPIQWDGISRGQRKTTLVSDIDLTCPCNLMGNSCDAGCCCDQDCSELENKGSTCISGFFGGATSERPFEFNCQASWPDARDWQPFLCVVIDNSPMTGFFYNVTSPSLAADSSMFTSLAETKKRERFTFVESEKLQSTVSGSLYRAGTTIKTAAGADDVSYAGATLGVLSLPQTVFNGLCSQTAPVRFLEEVSSFCILELDESLCNSQSLWSALNYLMPNKVDRLACSLPPAVLSQGRLNDTVGAAPELASTDVRYYCGDISDYVSMTTQGLEDKLRRNSSSLFDIPSLGKCAFDNETLPPSPAFDETTRMCSNVVVRVEYEFKWHERRIDAVTAKVTLGNVQIPAVKQKSGLATSDVVINTLSQLFSVNFIHSPHLNSSKLSQIPFQRSGNPGYLRGRPVLSRNLDNSSGKVTAGKMQLWSPDPSSLCADSTLTPVLYGEDAFSGCLLRLSLNDMRNCSFLRELVLTNQNKLIQATDIGRGGNADLDVTNDWLPVITRPIANNWDPSLEEGTCPGIPSGLVTEMLVADAGKYGGVSQMEIVGTRIRFQYSTWRFKCVSGFGLSCSTSNDADAGSSHVPSPTVTPTTTAVGPSVSGNLTNPSIKPANISAGSSVTTTASLSGSPTEIPLMTPITSLSMTSTANKSITPAASLTVTSAASSSVTSEVSTGKRQYEPRFQYFMVTSSVVFIKVPAKKPQRVKRTAGQSGICYRDVCKEELFFPLTNIYQGEPREKTLALSLLLIFLALVMYAVTKPWG